MENTKVISVFGLERADYPYFLSKVFEKKKCRILLIDNSCSHDLFLSQRREDKEADYVEHGTTIFMRNKYVEPEKAGAFEKFDIVIIYHGYNIDYDLIEMSDAAILQTDYLPTNLQCIKENVDMEYINSINKESLFVVYRDKAEKVSEQYILKYIGLTGVENEYPIFFDEGNYNAYLSYCYNGTQDIKGLTTEFKAALNAVKTFLFGNEKKLPSIKKFGKAGEKNDHIGQGHIQ